MMLIKKREGDFTEDARHVEALVGRLLLVPAGGRPVVDPRRDFVGDVGVVGRRSLAVERRRRAGGPRWQLERARVDWTPEDGAN